MTRRKITQKTNRKEDLDPTKDEFINKTMSVLDWAHKRRRPIALMAGFALLIAIAFIVVDKVQKNAKNSASALLGKGLEAASAPVIPPSEDDPVPEADAEENKELTFESSSARATETLSKYQQLMADLGNSETGLMSVIGAAAAHLDLGQYDKAIEGYNKFLGANNPAVAWLKPTAVEGLCYALEASDKLDDAKGHLEKLIANENGVTAKMARYHSARIAEKQGDKETAVKLLKEVVDAYSEEKDYDSFAYLFVHARERLLALDPTADVPDPRGATSFNDMDPALLQQLIRAQQAGGQ